MTWAVILYCLTVVAFCGFTMCYVREGRGLLFVLFAATLAGAYVAITQVMGEARPHQFHSVVDGAELDLVAYHVDPEHIFLWVMQDNGRPLALVYPFSTKAANDLEIKDQEHGERGLMLRLKKRKRIESPFEVHPRPHQESPPKQ